MGLRQVNKAFLHYFWHIRSKFCIAFPLRKIIRNAKNLAKKEEKPCSTRLEPISPCHFQGPGFECPICHKFSTQKLIFLKNRIHPSPAHIVFNGKLIGISTHTHVLHSRFMREFWLIVPQFCFLLEVLRMSK